MNIKRFPIGPLWTNGYLVSDSSGRAFFIDPAAEIPTIMNWVADKNLELMAVLLTHGHIDHVAGLADIQLSSTVGDEIYINADDSKMITSPDKEFGHRLGFDFDGVESVNGVNDGDKLHFGSLTVEVIATPGHTEGSVCFLVTDENGSSVLFSGDTLFAGSVGRTDLAGGDNDKLIQSLVKLSKLPSELEVYPGHGPSTTIIDETRRNPFWPK